MGKLAGRERKRAWRERVCCALISQLAGERSFSPEPGGWRVQPTGSRRGGGWRGALLPPPESRGMWSGPEATRACGGVPAGPWCPHARARESWSPSGSGVVLCRQDQEPDIRGWSRRRGLDSGHVPPRTRARGRGHRVSLLLEPRGPVVLQTEKGRRDGLARSLRLRPPEAAQRVIAPHPPPPRGQKRRHLQESVASSQPLPLRGFCSAAVLLGGVGQSE